MTDPVVLQAKGGSGSNFLNFDEVTTEGSSVFLFITSDSIASGTYPSAVNLYVSGGTEDGSVFQQEGVSSLANPIAQINTSLWRCKSCLGNETGIAFTVPGAITSGVIYLVVEVSGLDDTEDALFVQESAAPSGAETSFDTGSAGTAPSGSFLIAGIDGIGSGGRGVATPSGSWTNETAQNPGSAHSVLLSHQVLGSSGPTEYAGSLAIATYWAAIVAAYAPAGSSPPPPPTPSQFVSSGLWI